MVGVIAFVVGGFCGGVLVWLWAMCRELDARPITPEPITPEPIWNGTTIAGYPVYPMSVDPPDTFRIYADSDTEAASLLTNIGKRLPSYGL